MRPFDYTRPASLDEAIQLLQADGAARPLAGGTDIITLLKAEIIAPSQLLDIKRLPELSAEIAETERGLTLGALVTLADIERHAAILERYTALAEAAGLAATPQLRNMATLGGNLLQRPRCWYFRDEQFDCWLKGGTECHARDGQNGLHAVFDVSPCVAVHPSDLASALVALDASVRLRGPQGERTVPLAEFFAPPTDERRTETTLARDELIVAVEVPRPQPGTRSTYHKAMDRKVWAFALVGVAAVLRVEGDSVADARIVLSGVAPIPWRVEAAEQAIVGQAIDAERIGAAASAALAGAAPLQHNGYKVPLAESLVRSALEALAA